MQGRIALNVSRSRHDHGNRPRSEALQRRRGRGHHRRHRGSQGGCHRQACPRRTNALAYSSSAGRVLAANVVRRDGPAALRQLSDGRVRGQDSPISRGAGPWKLSVSGRIAAGDSSSRLQSRPNGSHPHLHRRARAGGIRRGGHAGTLRARRAIASSITKRPRQGENIRYTAEDVRAGDALLDRGRSLTAQRLALLAAKASRRSMFSGRFASA